MNQKIRKLSLTAVTFISSVGMAQQLPPSQAQPQNPCVTAPAPAKKPGWAERIKERAKQRLEQAVLQQEIKAGGKIGKETKGNWDGGMLPSVPDIMGGAAKPPKPCIAASGATAPPAK